MPTTTPKDRNKQYYHSSGYILLYRPEHPYCDSVGLIGEHRLVEEQKIGHYINPKTHQVHHINGVKDDNRPENLMVVLWEDHAKYDKGWGKIDGVWHKPCSSCKKFLSNTPNNFYFRKKGVSIGKCLSRCIECLKKQMRDKKHTLNIPTICSNCGSNYYVNNYTRKNKPNHFCTRRCYYAYKKRSS